MSWIQKFDKVKSKGGAAFLKIKEGENLYRFFTFKHTLNEGDFVFEREQRGSAKVGDVTEQGFVISRKHFNPFSMCGKMKSMTSGARIGKCEVCDLVDELKSSEAKSEQESGKRREANDSYSFVVVDLSVQPYSYGVLELSRNNGLTVLEEEAIMQKKGKSLFGFTGQDISIRYSPKEPDNKKKYKVSRVDSSECVTLKPSQVQGTPPDLYGMEHFIPDSFKQFFVPNEEAPAQGNNRPPTEDPAPVAKAAPATAAKAPGKAKAASKKAEPTWPPVEGQNVLVAFGEEKKPGVCKDEGTETGDDGTRTWQVEVEGDVYACTLEEMAPVQ